MLLRGTAWLLLYFIMQLVLCKDLYKILELKKDATDKQIKSAYKKLSKKWHPDKNPGDESAHGKFVEISEAYEALSDSETRRIYDNYGYEGLKQREQGGGFQHHDPFDVFGRFFGGGGHFDHGGERRGPSREVQEAIPLREFYNGARRDITYDKQQICEACDGTGAADRRVEMCGQCNGAGQVLVRKQLAPGFVQQYTQPCGRCGGRGKTIKHECSVCKGQRVVRGEVTLTYNVQRGIPPGARVVFENEGDAHPDYVAGDFVVQLLEMVPTGGEVDNPDLVDGVFFRRRGNDLIWREVLSLREAWIGGWSRNLTHMDGHVVRLGRPRGQTVQPGHVDTITGEGMPVWHEDGDSVYHDTQFGNLFVEYTVVLPDQMEKSMAADFQGLWDKWMAKAGVDLFVDSARPDPVTVEEKIASRLHEEL